MILDTMSYRMVEMQIMNTVNIGIKNNISENEIKILSIAFIDVTQLFLTDNKVLSLKAKLNNRLEKAKNNNEYFLNIC